MDEVTPEMREAVSKALEAWKALPDDERLSPEAVRDDGWQPIETAPRDGTEFLVWCPKSKLSLTRYNSPIESESWSITGPCWVVPEPTHWRPLPPPPAIRKDAPDA